MKTYKGIFILLFICFLFPFSMESSDQLGIASYYARTLHGRQTTSGIAFNENRYVAAHRTIPFGTYVRVINLRNRRSVIVEIVDRGPFTRNRIIDLSYAAAKKLNMIKHGVTDVKIQILGKRSEYTIYHIMKLEHDRIFKIIFPIYLRRMMESTK